MQRYIIVLLSIIFLSCDWPFGTKPSDNDVFELEITHNITRVMPTANILLSWSEITVENFLSYRVERMATNDTSWTSVAVLDDEFVTSYNDTISDDEDLNYRVGIVDVDDKIVWAEGFTAIPKTRRIIVPDEFQTIQPAFECDLMDSGDTILVNPGYYAETLYIAGKDVLIKSTDGYKNTTLTKSVIPLPFDQLRVVNMLSGRLEGFTIKDGEPWHGSGGGVVISNDAVVSNCFITENNASAYKNGGYGGGVYIKDEGKLYNSFIINNISFKQEVDGIYAHSAHGEIVNNTIVGNDVQISGDCSGLLFRNNIIYDSNPDLHFKDSNSEVGVTIDYNMLFEDNGIGENNIIGYPLFVDEVDFMLKSFSPAVDGGHPDSQYNDIDGSRNDMGTYGGPLNTK